MVDKPLLSKQRRLRVLYSSSIIANISLPEQKLQMAVSRLLSSLVFIRVGNEGDNKKLAFQCFCSEMKEITILCLALTILSG